MRTTLLSAIAIVFFSIGANAQLAQNSTSQTVTLNLSNKIDIEITTGAGGVVFDFDATSKYENGLANATAAVIQVKSNRPWTVDVAPATNNFSYNGGAGTTANNTMPGSILGVKLSTASSYTNLKDATTPLEGFTTGARGVSSFTVGYEAKPGFTYDAGAYALNVVYTATQE